MQSNPLITVLVAVRTPSLRTLTNALEPDFNLILCDTRECAQKAVLDGSVDVILCGVNFDESQMFQFLEFTKSNSATKKVPFVCIRVIEELVCKSNIPSLRMAAQVRGASFFDYFNRVQEFDTQHASKELRGFLHQLLDKH